jgi:hypothetical protein
VKRVHVGTHSREIEDGLRRLFRALGWQSLADYACLSSATTPFGMVSFRDGVQSWLNPRFAHGAASVAPRVGVEAQAGAVVRNDSAPDQLTSEHAHLASTIAALRERVGRLEEEAKELRRRLEKRKLRIEQLKAERTKQPK